MSEKITFINHTKSECGTKISHDVGESWGMANDGEYGNSAIL